MCFPSTLNVNGIGATAIQLSGSALNGGEIVANQLMEATYDATAFQLHAGSGTTLETRIIQGRILNAFTF